MKTKTYQNKEEWFEARLGKITGSRLKDLIVKRGTGKKLDITNLLQNVSHYQPIMKIQWIEVLVLRKKHC